MTPADEALAGFGGEFAVVGERTYDLQELGPAHCETVLTTPPVTLTPVMSEVERLWATARIVVRGRKVKERREQGNCSTSSLTK